MYDPLFSQLEITVLSALGVVVLRENEVRGEGRGVCQSRVDLRGFRGNQREAPACAVCADCDRWWWCCCWRGRGRGLCSREALLLEVPCPWAGGCSPAPAGLWLNPQMGGSPGDPKVMFGKARVTMGSYSSADLSFLGSGGPDLVSVIL